MIVFMVIFSASVHLLGSVVIDFAFETSLMSVVSIAWISEKFILCQ